MRWRVVLGVALAALLQFVTPAFPQATVKPCITTGVNSCPPVSASNPMPISGTVTASGTQDTNITQILGAAPSATNPLWVSPATASTPWIVTGSGTAGSAAAGTLTVQGIASMTPVQTTLPTTGTIAAGNAVVPATSSEAGAASTVISTSALAANLAVKGSAGNLYGFEVAATSTLSAAAWWIMIYDATAAPSDGAVTPAKCYALPLGATTFSASFPFPARFATGVTIGVSTTGCFTKTASTNAFISGDFK